VLKQIVSIGEKQGKRIRIIPDYQQFGPRKLQIDSLGSLQIITLRSLPLDIIDNKIWKRTFDIIFSILVITCLFSWLFPVIALIIKLTSKGPIFFKQARWGLNNKSILCYKFRSMVTTSTDVDENGNYQQATKNDPRVTPIGAFLRKTNLDELPQFINVLMGSTSVVGPRPHPVPLNLQSKDCIENYMRRHMVKPCITGWAQVTGFRGETRDPQLMQKRVEADVWYIENWTFLLDLQIILQTLVNMVKGEKNAF
jgi:putative colanic acid biosynthesis UDP-glucose lipid carrier transferase